jgi:nitroreductase
MKDSAKIFNAIVNDRRSVRVYDAEAPFDEEAVARSLQRAVLAPNSSNMQLWEFYRIKDKNKKELVSKYCMGQRAAKTSREIIIIVCRRDKWKERKNVMLENLKNAHIKKEVLTKRDKRALNYYGKLMPLHYFTDWFGVWGALKKIFIFFASFFRPVLWQVGKYDVEVMVHKSAALAAQTFMLSMQSEGYDTCPMEGFDSRKIKRLLHLPAAAQINMIIACGPGAADGIYNERIRVPESAVIFTI